MPDEQPSEHDQPSEERPGGDLPEAEQKDAEERAAPSAVVVHEAIRQEGVYELSRPPSALAWSGLAAGLSMGFSLIAEGLLHAHLPAPADEATAWQTLISKLGYSIGFLIVVLGRQQLFTENTLTPIIPLLKEFRSETLFRVARLWAIVLAANLIGAFLIAWILGNTSVFDESTHAAFGEIAGQALRASFGTTLLRGVFAGWLIALMVWLLPAAESGRVVVIILITYLVSLGGFSHIVAGAVDVLYLVTTGAASWRDFFLGFTLPTLLGNIIGGVSLVAALNHAQVVSGEGGSHAPQGNEGKRTFRATRRKRSLRQRV